MAEEHQLGRFDVPLHLHASLKHHGDECRGDGEAWQELAELARHPAGCPLQLHLDGQQAPPALRVRGEPTEVGELADHPVCPFEGELHHALGRAEGL
ncbi:hypothetical protein ACIBW9_36810 [Streptomyces sp. NPDC049541]|uniref:hypothetical protein n=1 Tax=Streptomyces sp. NPDC049541 TaxID=3365594 RepID=UPI0037B3D289